MGNRGSTMRHDETTLSVAGAPVRCYRAGPARGPALVLLHGRVPDSAQAAWAPVWTALTPHARLLAPDLPGHGGSPLGATAPTVEGYRAWLLAFLDASGVGRATMAGLALGGGIAVGAALAAPARVAGLVLLAPCGMDVAGLPRIACPVRLLAGALDPLVPPGEVRGAAARIPGSRFALVPGAGHRLPGDAADRVAAELAAAVAGARPAGHQ